jgi:hypothetical protein
MVYRYTSTIVNKNERVEAHKKKAAKMAKKCGWVDPFDELPEENIRKCWIFFKNSLTFTL